MPEILNCILADDVRTEITGKAILIGVYSGDILLSALPAQLQVCLWIQLKYETPGDWNLSIEFNLLDEKVAEIGASTTIEDVSQLSTFATPPLPLIVQKEGSLIGKISFNGGHNRILIEKAVRLGTFGQEPAGRSAV
jgi:hypothetical protein